MKSSEPSRPYVIEEIKDLLSSQGMKVTNRTAHNYWLHYYQPTEDDDIYISKSQHVDLSRTLWRRWQRFTKANGKRADLATFNQLRTWINDDSHFLEAMQMMQPSCEFVGGIDSLDDLMNKREQFTNHLVGELHKIFGEVDLR